MKKLKGTIIHWGILLSVVIGLYYLGMPWYVVAVILLLSAYWYGPIVVYFTQRMPAVPSIRPLGSEETLPPEISKHIDRTVPLLQGNGFVKLGHLVHPDKEQTIRATATLLQHKETSDMAHLLIATQKGQPAVGETLGFSRGRSDGSRISTSRSTLQSPFPPPPSDSVLRLDSGISALDVWRVHQARVAADTGAVLNADITDAFGYQIALEREGVRRHIASGLWRQDEKPDFLRPTPKGALLMCMRMLAPWKQISRMRGRSQMRHYLREYERLVGNGTIVLWRPADSKNSGEATPMTDIKGDDISGEAFQTQKEKSEKIIRDSAAWFYWIAGLSVINSAIVAFGGNLSFIMGLGATQLVDAIALSVSAETNAVLVRIIATVLNLIIWGLFVFFGVFAGKKRGWSFIAGITLYALDGTLFLLVRDWLSIGFHFFVLFFLFRGYKELRNLRNIERRLKPNVAGGGIQ